MFSLRRQRRATALMPERHTVCSAGASCTSNMKVRKEVDERVGGGNPGAARQSSIAISFSRQDKGPGNVRLLLVRLHKGLEVFSRVRRARFGCVCTDHMLNVVSEPLQVCAGEMGSRLRTVAEKENVNARTCALSQLLTIGSWQACPARHSRPHERRTVAAPCNR